LVLGPTRDEFQLRPGTSGIPRASLTAVDANVPVAVPLGSTFSQSKTVNHAVAQEPMVSGRIDALHRVRSIAEITPVQVTRQFTDHFEIESRHFLFDRCEVPREIDAPRRVTWDGRRNRCRTHIMVSMPLPASCQGTTGHSPQGIASSQYLRMTPSLTAAAATAGATR